MLSESRSIMTSYPYLSVEDLDQMSDQAKVDRVDLSIDEASEAVDHPTHYHAESGIEVIDAIEAWGLNFTLGNVIKYVARSGHKHDAREDLQKALWYLTHELSKYES